MYKIPTIHFGKYNEIFLTLIITVFMSVFLILLFTIPRTIPRGLSHSVISTENINRTE
jgi:hypothetical protein